MPKKSFFFFEKKKKKFDIGIQDNETGAKINNIPGQGAALRSQQERQNQPLLQERCTAPGGREAADRHEPSPAAHTSAEEGEGDLGTEPDHDPEADRASKEGDRWGWRPQWRDL